MKSDIDKPYIAGAESMEVSDPTLIKISSTETQSQMNFFKRIFRKSKIDDEQLPIDLTVNDTDKQLINEFSKLDADSRIKKIMHLGDTAELQYFKLLQYTILHDPDVDVKFSALKRIHLFREHPDLEPMLIQLKSSKKGDQMEPYLSMALLRLGMITKEQFEQKINGS